MKLLHYIHKSANSATLRFAKVFRRKWLPSYFNGRWCKFPVSFWPGWRHCYEPYVTSVLMKHLCPGSVFIDIGANVGTLSVFAATIVGAGGKVFCCEASPTVYKDLLASTVNYPWVNAVNCGAGAMNGEMDFYEGGISTMGSFAQEVSQLSAGHTPGAGMKTTSVPLKRLDSLLAEHRLQPNLIKVDVEGYELEVLRGAPDTLSQRTAAWLIEVHPWQLQQFGGASSDIKAILDEYGYHSSIIDTNPNTLFTLFAEPN